MERAKLNYLVDILMVIFFFGTIISSLVLFFILPGGQKKAGFQEFLNIPRRGWMNIHSLSGLIFIILSLIHLVLHWRWIWEMTKNIFKGK